MLVWKCLNTSFPDLENRNFSKEKNVILKNKIYLNFKICISWKLVIFEHMFICLLIICIIFSLKHSLMSFEWYSGFGWLHSFLGLS